MNTQNVTPADCRYRITCTPRYWASPENLYHDWYQRAVTRRFYLALAVLTAGGAFLPGCLGVATLVPVIVFGGVAALAAVAGILLAGASMFTDLRDWLQGE